MPPAFWFIIGVLTCAAAMVPVIRAMLKRARTRAREAERRARESERLAELGSMTGGLAHEIKNPLSTIGLNAQLLAEGLREAPMDEEHRSRLVRRLDALGREAERLRGILTDFLHFAGRMNLDAQPHDLVALSQEVSDFFLPQCDHANITMRVDLPDTPVVVELDESLVKQSLLNLLINAVQAMSGSRRPRPGESAPTGERVGEIILRVAPNEDGGEIRVADTGPGIAADELDRIFHPYVSRSKGGTGLGLPTARRIIEEHGGTLTAHSEVGRGSEFVIALPRKASVS